MAKKKELTKEISEILAEDFVGPPLPERRRVSPFAADYVNAPPGYEPAPTKPLDWYEREYEHKGIAPFIDTPSILRRYVKDGYMERSDAARRLRLEAHPASEYYGPGNFESYGSRRFYPGYEQVPESREFYPPPTISNEEQEMIDAERGALTDAIERALKESKKKDK